MSKNLKGGFTITNINFLTDSYDVYKKNNGNITETEKEVKKANPQSTQIPLVLKILDKIEQIITNTPKKEREPNILWNKLQNTIFGVTEKKNGKLITKNKILVKIINGTNLKTLIEHIIKKKNEKANQNSNNNNEPTTSNNNQISSDENNIDIDGLIKEIETFDKQTLTGYIKKSNDVLASIRENIKKILESNLTNSEVTVQLQDQIKNITLENDRLKEEKIELEEEKKEKDATIVKLTNQINENNRLFAQTKEKSVSTKKQLDNLKKQQDNNKNTETDLRNQINNLNEKLKEINDTREKLVGELDNEKKKVEEMTREINKINMIRTHFNSIVKKTEELSANNTTIKDEVKTQVNSINNKQSNTGGYQYKSKNKTRSKRMLKLNRFGLLKSKSKTRKGKKKLKVKKNKKSVKGGMKTRSKPKRKSKKGKKTRKGKKKNNKRK